MEELSRTTTADASTPAPSTAARRRALLALLLLVPAPSIGAVMALGLGSWEPPGAAGRIAWAACKLWLLAMPLVWHLCVDRGSLRIHWPRREGMGLAVASGLTISAVIVAAYLVIGRTWIDPQQARMLASRNGLDEPLRYLGLAIYTCTVNAVLEEYVWRWFVFRKCEEAVGARRPGSEAMNDAAPRAAEKGIPGAGAATWAVALSALLFTVHHIFALIAYFDWRVAVTACIGIFIGGALWSWFYLRYRSIWPGYVSHAIVDVAVFGLGWWIMFG